MTRRLGVPFGADDPMKDESMVEVLARALCDAEGCDWESIIEVGDGFYWGRDEFQKYARACLQALLDHGPTEEMVEAGRSTVGGHLRNEAVAPIFRAMISKALGK